MVMLVADRGQSVSNGKNDLLIAKYYFKATMVYSVWTFIVSNIFGS